MPEYRLSDPLHFCLIGGEPVFLDLDRDLYFGLPPGPSAAFRALLEAGAPAPASADIAYLMGAGILVAAPRGRALRPARCPQPSRSLVEEEGRRARPGLRATIETAVLVLRARRAVMRKRVPAMLGSLSIVLPAKSGASIRRDRETAAFRSARRLIPVAPNCLYDSLALHHFLRRRGIGATLAIGVKLHPFGAHCWLQDGDTVLNDSLAAVLEFEPLLVA